jgi:hypothetical protein
MTAELFAPHPAQPPPRRQWAAATRSFFPLSLFCLFTRGGSDGRARSASSSRLRPLLPCARARRRGRRAAWLCGVWWLGGRPPRCVAGAGRCVRRRVGCSSWSEHHSFAPCFALAGTGSQAVELSLQGTSFLSEGGGMHTQCSHQVKRSRGGSTTQRAHHERGQVAQRYVHRHMLSLPSPVSPAWRAI